MKAKEVIASFNEFEELTRNLDSKPDIYIGASMAFGEIVLPTLLQKIKAEIPNVDPRLYIEKPNVLEEKILNGDLDFAIAEGLVSNPHIKTDLVGKDMLIVFCAPDYHAPDKLKLEDNQIDSIDKLKVLEKDNILNKVNVEDVTNDDYSNFKLVIYKTTGNTDSAGGEETRPKNRAYLPIIKY